MNRTRPALATLLTLLSLTLTTPAFAQDALPNVTALFKAQKSKVVSIQTEVARPMPLFGNSQPGVGQGSGFIVDSDGYVITNNHVLEGATSIRVALDNGESFEAELVGADPKTDIALVKIDAGRPLPAVTFGRSDQVEVGQWVVAIGNPFGLDYSVTAGIVSAKGRNIGAGPYDDFIQTDASINPGNSGGPLFDMRGNVVGVNTAIIRDGAGIGFAVPVDLVTQMLPQLRQNGYVVRGYIGTGIQDLGDELAESFGVPRAHGVLIGSVEDSGPAADAGIRPGDIITVFGGERVRTTQELLREVAKTPPGQHADVSFERSGKRLTAKLRIAARPDAQRPPSRPAKTKPSNANSRTGVVLRSVDVRVARAMGMAQPRGVLVERVISGSAASKVLRAGDVILEAHGTAVNTPADFDATAAKVARGKVVRLLVVRDGRTLFVGLRL
jgi:serine protease Do